MADDQIVGFKREFNRCVVAVSFTVTAFVIRYVVVDLFNLIPPQFIAPFVIAAVAAAWYGGFWAGVLSTAVSAIGLASLYFESPQGFRVDNSTDILMLISFFSLGMVGSWVARFIAGSRDSRSWVKGPSIPLLASFAAAYVLAAGLGQGLALIPGVSITFWPPSGVFLAVLLVNPPSQWPGFILSAGLAELSCNNIWFHNSTLLAVIYFMGNSLESLTAAWLVGKFAGRPFRLEKFSDAIALAILGAGIGPVVGATVIASTDALIGKHPFTTAWLLAWLGDGTGLLVSTPLALAIIQIWRGWRAMSARQIAEVCVLTVLLVSVCSLTLHGYLPTVYLTMPLVLWAAVRFELYGAAAAVALLTLTTAAHVAVGANELGAVAEREQPKVIMLQIFLGVTAVCATLTAILSLQRQRALRALRKLNRNLDRRVKARSAKLGEKEELLRLALSVANAAAFTWDIPTNEVRRHNGIAKALGPTADAPETFESFLAKVHPDDAEGFERRVRCALAEPGAVYRNEYRVVGPDGSVRWIADTGKIEFSADDLPLRLVGMAVDVTDRKIVEDELRTSQAFIERVLKASPGTVYILDLTQQTTVYLNRDPHQDLGYSLEELQAMPPLLHPDDISRSPKFMARWETASDQDVLENEIRLKHRNGQWRWRMVREMVFERNAEGSVTKIIGVGVDITDRKRIEEQLRESEYRLRLAMSSAATGMWDWDLASDAVTWSPECYQIHGIEEGAFGGTAEAFDQLILPDDKERVWMHVRAAIDQHAMYECQFRIICPDGQVRWVANLGRAIYDEQGQPVRMIGTINDITKHKLSEEELRRSDQFNRSLMNGTADCIKVLDQGGRLLHMNQPGLCLMEIDEFGSMFGRQWVDLWPAEAQQDVRQALSSALGGTAYSFQAFCPTVKGTPKWWDVTVSPVRESESGSVVRVLSVSREITDRHKSEQERDRLVAVVENTSDFIACTDIEGSPVFVNRAGRELVGVDHDYDVRLTTISEYCVPEQRAFVKTVVLPTVLNHGRWCGELTFQHFKTGAVISVLYDMFRVDDPITGRLTNFATVTRDITERKRQEKELEVSQRTLTTLVERCPFGIYIVDADFRISSVNIGSQEGAFANVRPLVGRSYDEAIRIVWPAPVAEDVIGKFRHTLSTGEPYYSKDFMNHRADIDRTEGYEWELHRLTLQDGRYGVVCYYYDSTKLRQAEQKLKEVDQRKNEFLATLAHELRNPLAPIRNGLQIMKLTAGDAETVEVSRSMMERQVEQMTRLIEDLMDLSRISQGKIVLQKAKLQLAEVVQTAVDTSRPLIEERDHELLLDIPEEPIYVDGDLVRLSQVLANLLNNAAKYTKPGGRIRLAVERCDSDVIVAVEDNGMGIPAPMLGRVFDMFAQVDRSLENSQGGLGIGLNIVRRLVEMHGGSIAAQSEGPNRGSRFVVRLPEAQTDTCDTTDPRVIAKEKTAVRRRILVVDDNRDGATSLAIMLKIMGNDTRTAHDGLEAIAVAETLKPDVILMDIGMPMLNGYDACRRIREQPWGQNVVIVACTGWGQDEDKRKASEAGFDLHMTKPVDPKTLETLLVERRDKKPPIGK